MNMNKHTIITILLALVAMTTQGQTFTWRIEGTVANAAPTDTLTVIDAEKQRMITTLQVKDGNIVPASGMLDEPAVCCITKQGRRGWIRMFVLESGTVNITVDLDLVYLIRIGGTPMNDELMGVLAVQNTDMDMDTYVKKMCEVVSRIVSNHPDHPLFPFLIGQSKALFTSTESIGLIEKLSPDVQASPKMDRLKESLLLVQETEEGKMFKNSRAFLLMASRPPFPTSWGGATMCLPTFGPHGAGLARLTCPMSLPCTRNTRTKG